MGTGKESPDVNAELPERDAAIEEEFPELLKTGYEINSDCDPKYNCVAFALGDTRYWWEDTEEFKVHGYYWPPGMKDDLNGWIEVFRLHGYHEESDDSLEPEYEKIAIYALPDGPEHVARQKASGVWASKMGPRYDIIHPTLEALSGKFMGKISTIMKRKCKDGKRVLE